ncbi:MAG TPA: sorbosone dehydrogenase family protein, partial [Candidatus Sericytochromatia bacterium]
MKPLFLLLISLLAIAACDSTSASIESQTPQQTANSAQPKQQNLSKTKNQVTTQPLSPKPIRISLGSLPQPFASNSAFNSPNVIPIPANPSLRVPPGFVVKVFAEKLDA